jgi:hypothetical protein
MSSDRMQFDLLPRQEFLYDRFTDDWIDSHPRQKINCLSGGSRTEQLLHFVQLAHGYLVLAANLNVLRDQ